MATKPAQVLDSPSPADIDRCAYLLTREREGKSERDELAKLKSKFQKQCEAAPADASFRLQGLTGYLDITAREERREITDQGRAFKALRRAMGLDALILKLKLTFTLIDSAIPADKQTGFVSKERSGSRDISGGLLQTPVAA